MIGITGASGLIGNRLIGILLEESIPFSTFGLRRVTTSPLESFYFLDLDEFSTENFRSNLDGIKSFVHLAARLPAAVNQDYAEIKLLLDINACSSFGILQACKEAGVGKFIYLSGSNILRPLGRFITSASPFASSLHSPAYLVSKLAGELLCWNQRSETFDVNILRPASVYGYGMRSGVVKNFIESILNDIPVFIHGDGSWASDLVYVEDVASVIYHSLYNVLSSPLNIGTGNLTSIHQLALAICALCDKSTSLIRLETTLDTSSSSAGLPPVDPFEVESFIGRKLLGLREGLTKTIHKYQLR